MCYQRKWAASPEADLSHKRAEVFCNRADVIAVCAGWLVGVSIATDVGHEDRGPRVALADDLESKTRGRTQMQNAPPGKPYGASDGSTKIDSAHTTTSRTVMC
jgi:hypothetical protein